MTTNRRLEYNNCMRAIFLHDYGGPENLILGEWPDPIPESKEILVNVKASGVNRADIQQRKGKYPPPEGASPLLGLEMAGIVAGVGPDGGKWKEGDRVCGLLPGGGYAEYAVIHEDLALPIPKGLSFSEAAALPEVFMTAFQAVNWIAQFKPGEMILIHAGASGVGTAAIQLAREMNAEGIIVTASKPKHDLCLSLGADYAIDYKNEDFAAAVKNWTERRGVDVIIDFIAAPYFNRNIDVLRKDGRLVILAFLGGVKIENVNLVQLLTKRLQINGTTLRSRDIGYKITLAQELYDFAWERFTDARMKPVIDSVFQLEEAAEAHRYMEENKNSGKIVLKIS